MAAAVFRLHSKRHQEPISSEPFHEWSAPDGSAWILAYRSGEDYMLRFPDIADYAIACDGSRVDAWPAPDADPATVEHLFMNQVGPLAASRAGLLVLHASAVSIAGACVAFVGETGRGKSTLAAACAAAGLPFLADDGLQIRWNGDRVLAVPSYPSIRLWADSESMLASPALRRAPPVQYTTKARILAGPTLRHCGESLPLARIYLLGEGVAKRPEIEHVRPSLAALELVRHSFLLGITETALLARHFEQVSRLADLGLLYHLDYPRSYDGLEELRAAILSHASDIPPA